jgi:hypothetical protein
MTSTEARSYLTYRHSLAMQQTVSDDGRHGLCLERVPRFAVLLKLASRGWRDFPSSCPASVQYVRFAVQFVPEEQSLITHSKAVTICTAHEGCMGGSNDGGGIVC